MALSPDESYVTVEEADAFFVDRLDSPKWTTATAEEKEVALKLSTRAVDAQQFWGEPTSESQALQWPRDGESTIPNAVIYATCLQAEAYLQRPDILSRRIKARADGVEALDLGELRESYANDRVEAENLLCPEARVTLDRFIRKAGCIT
jgi:hypothetical protein